MKDKNTIDQMREVMMDKEMRIKELERELKALNESARSTSANNSTGSRVKFAPEEQFFIHNNNNNNQKEDTEISQTTTSNNNNNAKKVTPNSSAANSRASTATTISTNKKNSN